MASVVDYTKFDRLELSDDEDDNIPKGTSAAEARYKQREIALKTMAAKRGESVADEEKGVDPSQRLSRDGEKDDENESSSDYDSDIEDNPLFWKKLPKNWKENPTVRAMEKLRDETPPEEMAEEMKDQGNQWYTRTLKEKVTGTRLLTYHRNALKCYTNGLNYAHSAPATEEVRLLHATLLVNRAAVQLSRKNYRKVVRDCRGALRFDPNNLKGHYRAAQALYKLRRYDEASVFVESALALDATNKAVLKCQKQIAKSIGARDARIATEEARIAKKRATMDILQSACEVRGIRMGPALFELDSDKRKHRPQVFGEGVPGQLGPMVWPVMLLYEEHAQNDYVQQFGEDSLLRDLIDMVLPDSDRPPWDEDHKYCASNVQLFFETKCVPPFPSKEPWPMDWPVQSEREAGAGNLREWVQIPFGLRLTDVLSLPAYVVPQIVTFHVVPKSGSFHDEFMRRHKGHLRTLELGGQSRVSSTSTSSRNNSSASKTQKVVNKKKKKKKKTSPTNKATKNTEAEAVPANDLD